MRIILVGKMGSGKDSVADILERRYVFFQFAFADKLKQIAKELFPEEFKEGNKPRAVLQDLGKKMREIEPDCWTNYLIGKIESHRHKKKNIVITDCRYKNELEIAKQHGFVPVRVICDDEIRFQRLYERDGVVDQETRWHVSETELDDVEIGHVIDNSGTKEQLREHVVRLVENLRLGGSCDA